MIVCFYVWLKLYSISLVCDRKIICVIEILLSFCCLWSYDYTCDWNFTLSMLACDLMIIRVIETLRSFYCLWPYDSTCDINFTPFLLPVIVWLYVWLKLCSLSGVCDRMIARLIENLLYYCCLGSYDRTCDWHFTLFLLSVILWLLRVIETILFFCCQWSSDCMCDQNFTLFLLKKFCLFL